MLSIKGFQMVLVINVERSVHILALAAGVLFGIIICCEETIQRNGVCPVGYTDFLPSSKYCFLNDRDDTLNWTSSRKNVKDIKEIWLLLVQLTTGFILLKKDFIVIGLVFIGFLLCKDLFQLIIICSIDTSSMYNMIRQRGMAIVENCMCMQDQKPVKYIIRNATFAKNICAKIERSVIGKQLNHTNNIDLLLSL